MQLTFLKIENLRGIVSEEIDIHKFTSIIGPNNCCKSTVLRAIQILLNQDRPELDEWNCDSGDADVTLEARFANVTDEERVIPGIAGIIYNKEIRLRVVCHKAETVEVSYMAFIEEEEIKGW